MIHFEQKLIIDIPPSHIFNRLGGGCATIT